jgi:hypothetical protein
MSAIDRYSGLVMSQSEVLSGAQARQEDARTKARDRQQAEAALAIRHRREVLNLQTQKAALAFAKSGAESITKFIPGGDKFMAVANLQFAFGEYQLTKLENKASERAMLAEHEAGKAEAKSTDAKDLATAYEGMETRLLEALDTATNKLQSSS